ncbi:energy transducer TonB [Fluviicola sp.]|uniref:TonB family protein n=1 Tax=Fluviicola sp. TaxID=1917219 RepID=UPI002626A06A|nr:energy transducer TonB [Fluviicola sp.]
MKHLLTALLILVNGMLFSQNKRDTIYFDHAWNVTKISDSVKYYRIIREEDNLYKVSDYYRHSDSLQMTGAFKDYAQKVKEGEFVYYEKNGTKSSVYNYKDGKLHGLQTSFYDSGALYKTENYVNGNISGNFIVYYQDGKLRRKETYKKGKRTFKACYLPNGKKTTFFEYEIAAVFQKGQESIIQYIKKNLRYPQIAVNEGMQGKVYIQFVVSDRGAVKNVKVKKSTGYQILDDEAVRIIKTMPEWTPGSIDGIPVNSTFSLPVSFKLD